MDNPLVNLRVTGYYKDENDGSSVKKLVYILNDGQWMDALKKERVSRPIVWESFDPYANL